MKQTISKKISKLSQYKKGELPGIHKIFKIRFCCPEPGCNWNFVRNVDLVRHKTTHAPKTFECSCNKRFRRKDGLDRHKSSCLK